MTHEEADKMADQISQVAAQSAARAVRMSTRFEIGTLLTNSKTGKVSTTSAGRSSPRTEVSMAQYQNLNPGDAYLMLGSGLYDSNFGIIPSPWAAG